MIRRLMAVSVRELSAKSNIKQEARRRVDEKSERAQNSESNVTPFGLGELVAVLCFHYPSESREHGRQTLVPGLRSAGTVLQTK